jgi:hypothetical protein
MSREDDDSALAAAGTPEEAGEEAHLATTEPRVVELIRGELAKVSVTNRRRLAERLAIGVAGSIPWVGDLIAATMNYKLDARKGRHDDLQTLWLEEHTRKLGELLRDLQAVAGRVEALGPEIDERLQSDAFLAFARRTFRAWDHADTDEKRAYAGNLLYCAAVPRRSSDDILRTFVDWLDLYSEAHFAVVKQLADRPGSTRLDIWRAIYGEPLRDDSADAELFRLLVRDLSVGGVIRQERETTETGAFVRRRPRAAPTQPQPQSQSPAPATLESAFEDTKRYRLTALGADFVRYAMEAPPPGDPPA